MNWRWSLGGKCLQALRRRTEYPVFDEPCKKTFLSSNWSGTSESEMNPFGTKEDLHFSHCTNIFAAFSVFIDLAIKNLISVGSSYFYTHKRNKNSWAEFNCSSIENVAFLPQRVLIVYLGWKPKLLNWFPNLGQFKF